MKRRMKLFNKYSINKQISKDLRELNVEILKDLKEDTNELFKEIFKIQNEKNDNI